MGYFTMINYIFKCVPRTDIDFYLKNLVYHITIFILIELIFPSSIGNFSILSGLLVADYRYYKDYRF